MSIEKMSAWLDGNLSAKDMLETAVQVQEDPMLRAVMDMSDAIDYDMESFEASGEALPDELTDNDFDLPNLDRGTDFWGDRLLGQVCCAAVAPTAMFDLDLDVAADAASPVEDEERSLLDKIKDLFKDEEDK